MLVLLAQAGAAVVLLVAGELALAGLLALGAVCVWLVLTRISRQLPKSSRGIPAYSESEQHFW